MITDKEQVYKLECCRGHHHPERYLKSYKFSQEVLLDVFCSEDLVFCYEDYYYDDICMDMIKEFQPHIDPDDFLKLWLDLDEIRIIELFCKLILNVNKKSYICEYKYNLIDDYISKYKKSNYNHTEIIADFVQLLQANKFSVNFNLYNSNDNLNEWDLVVEKAKQILNQIPDSYSSVLPL